MELPPRAHRQPAHRCDRRGVPDRSEAIRDGAHLLRAILASPPRVSRH